MNGGSQQRRGRRRLSWVMLIFITLVVARLILHVIGWVQ